MTTLSQQSESKFNRPHTIVPQDDTAWAIEQKPCVLRFWQQCWLADPYGSRWMKIVTKLSDSAFRLARRVLEAARLFVFRRISVGADGRTSIWEVRNLHGTRVKDFWQGEKNEADTDSNKRDTASTQVNAATNEPNTVAKTQSQQAFQKPSRTTQEHLTNSSKEFVRCVSSSHYEISLAEQTAITPLGGASPQLVESVEEKEEESPTANDCTSLTFVDATESQPAPPVAENQDCSDEPKDCHEGLCSAAPAVQHEQTFTNTEILNILDAANQGVCPSKEMIQVLLETPHARSLMGAITLNPQWGIKLSDYSTVPQGSKLRQERLNRLKSYAANCECPPDEFLLECQSDPVLKIQLSRLAARENWNI